MEEWRNGGELANGKQANRVPGLKPVGRPLYTILRHLQLAMPVDDAT